MHKSRRHTPGHPLPRAPQHSPGWYIRVIPASCLTPLLLLFPQHPYPVGLQTLPRINETHIFCIKKDIEESPFPSREEQLQNWTIAFQGEVDLETNETVRMFRMVKTEDGQDTFLVILYDKQEAGGGSFWPRRIRMLHLESGDETMYDYYDGLQVRMRGGWKGA